MEEIIQLFIRSFEDTTFTAAERKAVRELIRSLQPRAALYNHENILVTADKAVVAAYAKEFARLWAEMTPFGAR